MLPRLLWTLFVALAIPALGFWLAKHALADLTDSLVVYTDFASMAEEICVGSAATVFGGPGSFCIETARLSWLRDLSAATAVVTVLLLTVYVAAALIAGRSRSRNALIFPTLMPVAAWTVAALVLAQGVVLTGSVAVLAAGLEPVLFWALLAIVGGGALLGGASMIAALRAATIEQPMGVLGRALPRAEAPRLWEFVDEIAGDLGARRPKTLVVGLEPTFFATAAPIVTPESQGPIRGETLYLSLPLMRLFTDAELRAVVGHELGHFHGADTAFSMKFQPVYRTLAKAITGLDGEDGQPDYIATTPGSTILAFMFEIFARNERSIMRERELEADRAGVAVSSARAIAVSLAKVAIYAPLWAKIRSDNVARLAEGKISRNLSKVYAAAAQLDVNHHAIGDYLGRVLQTRIAHPTDSHPPLAERYEALGFDPRSLTIEDLATVGEPRPLFDEALKHEEALTLIEHKLMIASGVAAPPEKANDDVLLNAAYILAATMARADGEVMRVEVQTAEAIGAQMFLGFDSAMFRETFDQLADLPAFLSVVDLLSDPLPKEQLAAIHGFLSEIAKSDGKIDAREQELLDLAARRWGLVGRMTDLRKRLRRVR